MLHEPASTGTDLTVGGAAAYDTKFIPLSDISARPPPASVRVGNSPGPLLPRPASPPTSTNDQGGRSEIRPYPGCSV